MMITITIRAEGKPRALMALLREVTRMMMSLPAGGLRVTCDVERGRS